MTKGTRTKHPRSSGTRRLPPKQISVNAAWERYERLKNKLTANATTHEEYEAACRLAARQAGI